MRSDKENTPHNHRHRKHTCPHLHSPPEPPTKPPSTDPTPHVHHHLHRTLTHFAKLAEHPAHLPNLLETYPRLSNAITTALDSQNPTLHADVATLLSRLSLHPNHAEPLSTPPFLPALEQLLAPPNPHRLAARTLRNMAAFSSHVALSVARSSHALRLLIAVLHTAVNAPSTTDVEAVAALANFARAGFPFQAYLRKHDALSALCDTAHHASDASVRFHSVRALAEFSLHQKWLVQLISEGCVNIMLAIIVKEPDTQIASEATRFLGNLATTRIGREAVIGNDGVAKVVTRLNVAVNNANSHSTHLAADLTRTATNLCVSCKEASKSVIASGGVIAFIEAYTSSDKPLQEEAFRGLLIIAQAGHAFRASVLREIGIKIRQDASQGLCVAHLYDLSRRVKVEATAERKDDFPTTIAGLGAKSKQYLFQAGPLATDTSRMPDDTPHVPNSVPGMKSPDADAFRRSARLLSVPRPVLHKDRLDRERRERYNNTSRSDISSDDTRQRRPRAKACSAGNLAHDDSSLERKVSSHNKAHSDPTNVDTIPRCKVIENNRQGKDQSSGNWVLAVWSAVCNAVTRPANMPAPGSPRPKQGKAVDDGEVSEDVYEMGVPLGRGGFATVYLAKNLRTSELVAVKRFHPVNAATRNARKKAEMNARRAIKEQRIWDGLSHKNIVSYRGCFFGERGELNLVAEYVPGWSLADHLAQISKFPEHMVACITLQIVDGLDYLHKCGVTHRDVKPANILVNADGVIKITDFGVSSAVDVPTMTGNTLVGTPWYIAPEMIEGRPYGKSVDIWSLGCTVLELATGRRPYHHLNAHVALFRMTKDRMPPIPKKMSPLLRDFLKTCWVWDPAQRPTPAHLRRHPFIASVVRPEIRSLENMARKN